MTSAPPRPATLPEAHAVIEALWTEHARLRGVVARLETQVQELEARLGQNSSNSSQPPAADPPQAPPRPPQPASGRRRGAQPGHPAHQRSLLPPEQVDHTSEHWPTH